MIRLVFLPIIYLFSSLLTLAGIALMLQKRGRNTTKNKFSVIVVARNEEKTISPLLESLQAIDYPENLYEIILVDDNSDDDTNSIMQDFADNRKGVKVLKTSDPKLLPGKKEGLQKALTEAENDYIVLTDADCRVRSDWLKSLNGSLEKGVAMVVGYAPEDYSELSEKAGLISLLFLKFRRFTQIVSAGVYASTISLGCPFSCSGRNLCIKKENMLQVGGYARLKQYRSGDDKQMLNLINSSGGRIVYNFSKTVVTMPENENFLNQQKRRYGKSMMSSANHLLCSLFILLFFVSAPIYLLMSRDFFPFLVLYMSGLTFWLINLVNHREGFVLLDLLSIGIYPYYMLYFSITGLMGNWKWK
jgi:poly-beta-1,6-N-acetyl-D-glucosamine synthase